MSAKSSPAVPTEGRPRTKIIIPHERLAEFCRANQIRWLALFGSVLQDDFSPGSDVDVLVEFEPEAQVTLFTLGRLQRELEGIFARPVDFVLKDGLKRRIRDSALNSAQVVYAN